jgi:hypothetical protein
VCLSGLTAASLLIAGSRTASAQAQQQPQQQQPQQQAQQQQPQQDDTPKRPVPDYDGRGPDPSNTAGAGTWTARVLLSPLYLTSEYLLRQPIGALMRFADNHDLEHKLYSFFVFGPTQNIGFFPVGYIDYGYPSVGVFAFWDDALAKRNSIRLLYQAWPTDVVSGTITDRYRIDDKHSIQLRLEGYHRPDMVFFGLGPNSLQSSKSRFAESRFETNVQLDARPWRTSDLRATVGVRKVDVEDGHFGNDATLSQASQRGDFAIPYGFDRDYTAPYGSLLAAFDTRKPKAETGSGVRLEVNCEEGGDVAHGPPTGWIRYGATGAVYIDLNDRGRVLGIKVGALFADPLGSGQIPFTELVSLGGDKWMTGFFDGRLIDRSAAVATITYTWPIATSLDATLQGTVGNVFGAHLSDFKPNLLRFSAAVGLLSHVADPPIQLLVGFGSETFEHGGQIDAFRFAVGVPTSF